MWYLKVRQTLIMIQLQKFMHYSTPHDLLPLLLIYLCCLIGCFTVMDTTLDTDTCPPPRSRLQLHSINFTQCTLQLFERSAKANLRFNVNHNEELDDAAKQSIITSCRYRSKQQQEEILQ